ncbi:MAG: VCBS repeat-containing protein, partial [Nitrospirota bacterium]
IGAVAVVETTTGRVLDAVETPLQVKPEEFPRDVSDPVLQTLAARGGRAVREAKFSYRAEHAVIGDLDRDGVEELVVSDGNRLRVYRLTDRIDEQPPTLLAEEPDDQPRRRHLALDSADIHGLGRPQLFVTAMVGDRLDSYALAWQGGRLTPVAEHQPYYFRVLAAPGQPARLLAQRRALTAPFAGEVVRLRWTGLAYEEGDAMALPPSVGIYDFILADLDRDGRDELLYLDPQDLLIVLDETGERLGASEERFGGVESFIDYIPGGITRGSDSPPARARVPARMLVADVDGDGALDVMVPKNVPLTKRIERIRGYQYGQVFALGWDGGRLAQKWVIPRVEGVIADIGLVRAGTDGGAQVLVLANPTFTAAVLEDFFATSSRVLLYAVPRG